MYKKYKIYIPKKQRKELYYKKTKKIMERRGKNLLLLIKKRPVGNLQPQGILKKITREKRGVT